MGATRQAIDAWTMAEEPLATQYLLANISPVGAAKGAVVASPSTNSPNYFYHWVRDASMVSSAVVDLYQNAPNAVAKKTYGDILNDLIDFSRGLQALPPQGNIGGLGEPKYLVTGQLFTGSWGRPQNDGPALRAMAFTRLANLLLDEGQGDLVTQKLYRAEMPATTLIKEDLEYVAHHWSDTCFDLWEENHGHHFFTQMVQRKALLTGAALANRLNDSGAANFYSQQAAALETALERYWSPTDNFVYVTLDEDGGISYKTSHLDSAVVLGALWGDNADGVFTPDDPRILATAARLEQTFSSLYSVNSTSSGAPGILIGRYPEDRYDGYGTSSLGNGWPLITAAYAELYERAATRFEVAGVIPITSVSAPFFSRLGWSGRLGATGKADIVAGTREFSHLIVAMRSKADDFLARIEYDGQSSQGHYSEEVNRSTGKQQGAIDLTWNYAAFLSAFKARVN